MSIVAWIVLGVLAGVLANRVSGKRGTGLLEDVLLGTAGASFAGFAVNSLAAGERGQLNLWSLAASACGAVLVLALAASVSGPSGGSPVPARIKRRTRPVRR